MQKVKKVKKGRVEGKGYSCSEWKRRKEVEGNRKRNRKERERRELGKLMKKGKGKRKGKES